MRYGSMLLVLGLLLGGCTRAMTDAERENVVQEAESTVSDLFDAMNGHDPEAILSHYRADDRFVRVSCTSVRLGYESLSQIVGMYYRSNPDVTFEHEVLASQALDRDAAVVTVRSTTSEDVELYMTYVLYHADDGWKIAQEHESWGNCPPARRHPTGSEMMAPPLDSLSG